MSNRLGTALAVGLTFTSPAYAQDAISPEARNAVEAMGKTLANGGFSFEADTIREYADPNGQPLHIFHEADVVVRRPDRFLAAITGDDGASKAVYDGKNLVIYNQTANKYARLPITGSIGTMLAEASKRMGMDFPLADFLADDPGKAFLAGITTGNVVNTVDIDDIPTLHMFFTQPPGIELELWAEKESGLPRRLIVTYRSIPGEPRFIAELEDWKTGIDITDDSFTFQPPEGATQIDLGQVEKQP